MNGQHPRGAALVTVMVLLTLSALVAVCLLISVAPANSASGNVVAGLQADLLALAAREEAAAHLLLGLTPPAHLTRVISNRAGAVAGTYCLSVTEAARPPVHDNDRDALFEPRWYRDEDYCWQQPAPLNAYGTPLRAALRTAMPRVACAATRRLHVRLADALDPDDELSHAGAAIGGEALAFARLAPVTGRRVIPMARFDTAAWLHLGRLARGWGERYSAAFHFTVARSRSAISPRRATLALTADNLDAAARNFGRVLTTFDPRALNALGAAHQWRGTLIKAIGRHADSCIGGALTNLMWLRVRDNHPDGNVMVFDCEPVLEQTFPDAFTSNALGGGFTYALAGWHTEDDPLAAVNVQLPAPQVPGLLAPARCGAELAEHDAGAYVCDGAAVRGLDPAWHYHVALYAPPLHVPDQLEVFDDGQFRPVRFVNGEAPLYHDAAVRPAVAASGEGYLTVLLRLPAATPAATHALYGISVRAADPLIECCQCGTAPLDPRWWRLAWLSPAGDTQTLYRVPLHATTPMPDIPPQTAIRLAPDASAVRQRGQTLHLPVECFAQGPCHQIRRVVSRQYDAATGMAHIRLAIRSPVPFSPALSGACVRVVAARTPPYLATWRTNAAMPLTLLEANGAVLTLAAPRADAQVIGTCEPGSWLEALDVDPAWGGALCLISPRGECAVRVALRDLPPLTPSIAALPASGVPSWLTARRDAPRLRRAACVRNQPLDSPQALVQLVDAATEGRVSPWRLLDCLHWEYCHAALSNATPHALTHLAGTSACSNSLVRLAHAALPRDLLCGYLALVTQATRVVRGLIVSNDTATLHLALRDNREFSRCSADAHCVVQTPYGEDLWWLAAGVTATVALAPPWQTPLPTHAMVCVLSPHLPVSIAFSGCHGPSRDQHVLHSRGVCVSALHDAGRRTPIIMRICTLSSHGTGLLLTRMALLPCAAPARINVNTATPAMLQRIFPDQPQLIRGLLSRRPFHSAAALAATSALPDDVLVRALPRLRFDSFVYQLTITSHVKGAQTIAHTCATAHPRTGTPFSAVSFATNPDGPP